MSEWQSVADLSALSLAALLDRWEQVPLARQRSYRAAYERELQAVGAAGSDLLEQQLIEALLVRYREDGLVPVGNRWARTPPRVRAAARQPETEEHLSQTVIPRPAWQMAALLGIGGLLFAGFLLLRLSSSAVSPGLTPTPTLTPTPRISPTPTPLALEDQDEIIAAGDRERVVAYPVNLQVITNDEAVPRVWVVQRRRVEASEWHYDAHPDTASFISGLAVRPVIGIPWSQDNAAFFDRLGVGTAFRLTLNTGAVLRYEFADQRAVRRSDTSFFRQLSPGLVLLLLGETDDEGLPTATRPLVLARYPAEQELSRAGEIIAPLPVGTVTLTPLPTVTPPDLPLSGLDVQVIAMTTLPGQLTTRLRLYNSSPQIMTITTDDLWLVLGYEPRPVGPRQPAEGLPAFDLQPEQAMDLTLIWHWTGEPFGQLAVGAWQWTFELPPTH